MVAAAVVHNMFGTASILTISRRYPTMCVRSRCVFWHNAIPTTPTGKVNLLVEGTQAASDHSAPTNKADTSPLLGRKLPIPRSPPAPTPPPVPAPVRKSSLYVGDTLVDAAPPCRPSQPCMRQEIVRQKRIKVKPQLSHERAQSESVYFRKIGNESVSAMEHTARILTW